MITIDFAKTADLPSVQKLHIQSLGASFMESASSQLRAGAMQEDVMHLVARKGDVVVGSIQLRRIQFEGVGSDVEQKIAFLGPLVTDSKYKGQGLGSKLMESGLSLVQGSGFVMVFLVGDDSYYSRFGFRSVRPHNIALADDKDGDRLQVKMLGRPATLPVYARLKPYEQVGQFHEMCEVAAFSKIAQEQAWREVTI